MLMISTTHLRVFCVCRILSKLSPALYFTAWSNPSAAMPKFVGAFAGLFIVVVIGGLNNLG